MMWCTLTFATRAGLTALSQPWRRRSFSCRTRFQMALSKLRTGCTRNASKKAIQRTASKPATDVVRVCHPRVRSEAACRELAVANLILVRRSDEHLATDTIAIHQAAAVGAEGPLAPTDWLPRNRCDRRRRGVCRC